MKCQPLSEKTAEILFNRYFLQSFPLGSIELFAPSSFEEFKNGYDAKFYGASSFREIYLQFKAPTFSPSKKRFSFNPTRHQHEILKKYPRNSAFYVVPMISSFIELNSIQSSLKSAIDFLKHYVCIDASKLPDIIDFFHFEQPMSHRESPRLKFKKPEDGTTRTAKHPVPSQGWLRGNQLQDKFKKGDIGNKLNLGDRLVSIAEKDEFPNSFSKYQQFGDLLRIPIKC